MNKDNYLNGRILTQCVAYQSYPRSFKAVSLSLSGASYTCWTRYYDNQSTSVFHLRVGAGLVTYQVGTISVFGRSNLLSVVLLNYRFSGCMSSANSSLAMVPGPGRFLIVVSLPSGDQV